MAAGKIKICYAKINTNPSRMISPTSLRGFLGYLFINDPEFHHHSESSYHYPLVQYKVINKTFYIIGLNEYAENVFYKMSQLEYVILDKEKLKVTNVELDLKNIELKEQKTRYRFISPWIALNKQNYERFHTVDKQLKNLFLSKIFVGNILSALKSLKIYLTFRLTAGVDSMKSFPISANDNVFQGFYGYVTTNINLPNFIGLGKSVSKGFGTVEKIT